MSSQVEPRNHQRLLAKPPVRRVRNAKRSLGEKSDGQTGPSACSRQVLAFRPKSCSRKTTVVAQGVNPNGATTLRDERQTTTGKSPSKMTLPQQLPAHKPVGLPLKALDQSPQKLVIEYRSGDFFDAPPGTVLIHSCNCAGYWGKGIALEFRKRYRDAYETHRDACRQLDNKEMLGKAMLIGPMTDKRNEESKLGHYIGCLFTRDLPLSNDYDGDPIEVLQATEEALKGLLRGIQQSQQRGEIGLITELRMPKINSGLFRVPWELTEALLEGLEVLPGEHSISKVAVYI